MARGGYRPGAGRPRKDAKRSQKAQETPDAEPVDDPINPTLTYTPLEFMLAVMNDPTQSPSRRDRMAAAAAPFVHARAVEVGKKDAKDQAAKQASKGKFAASAPPKLSLVKSDA